MAPALNTSYTATDLALNATNIDATAAIDPTAISDSVSPALIVLSTIGLVLVFALSLVLVIRFIRDTLAARAHRKHKLAVRPLVLHHGTDKVEPTPAFQGPKPLLLPAMATVRSSRGKASLASQFLGRWGAAHDYQVDKSDVECAPSPTLVCSEDEKIKSTTEWTPTQLYKIPLSLEVPVSAVAPVIPVLAVESKPLGLAISEGLAAPQSAYNLRDVSSVDIAEVSPSPSRSFPLVPVLAADVASPAYLLAVPAIVVHNCSRPFSAASDIADADDRLCVPSATWTSFEEREELE